MKSVDMEDDIMTSKLLITTALILPLVILVFSGCLESDDGNYSQGEITYTITASNATSEERFILLPIPRERDGSASKLIDNIEVTSGSGSFQIVDDSFGKCIKITFVDEIILTSSGRINNSRDMHFFYFSMVDAPIEESMNSEYYDQNNFNAYVSQLNGNESIDVSISSWSKYYWEHGAEAGMTTQTMDINGQLTTQFWSQDISGRLDHEEGI